MPIDRAERAIMLLRGERVVLDRDLAALFGVSTKQLNQQTNRNLNRFPPDFMFQLTSDEKAKLVADCEHLAKLKFSPTLPFAFTEHGAIMAASVLKSPRAVEMSVFVVRAFVRLRQMAATHETIMHRLKHIEDKLSEHDEDIQEIVAAVRGLMNPEEKPKRSIGFQVREKAATYNPRG